MPVAHPRLHLIVGLHALAGFLEVRPDIPTPDQVIVHHFIPRADDADMRAGIERLAALLGTPVDSDGGHVTTSLTFGPVEYRAVAILSAARARYAAHDSYRGCVTPDTH
ncbi:hypothetical protein [Nonomuraea sp. NPDC049158]|uniref:hypothetical protein n=1 Tax=Nonomuraea sp. NPDC049158 TaxID=3155649 RepID=UPI0033F0342A